MWYAGTPHTSTFNANDGGKKKKAIFLGVSPAKREVARTQSREGVG